MQVTKERGSSMGGRPRGPQGLAGRSLLLLLLLTAASCTEKSPNAATTGGDAVVDGSAALDGAALDATATNDATNDAIDDADAEPADTDAEGPDTAAPDTAAPDVEPQDGTAIDDTADADPDAAPLVCTSAEQCPQPSVPCQERICSDGSCGFVASADASSCVSPSKCAASASCLAGKCVVQLLKSCDDGNVCTSDACDAKTGQCLHSPATELDGVVCSDGSLCTLKATCFSGVCVASIKQGCDDGDPCTTDICDPATGACVFKPGKEGDPCDDGTSCTEGDHCDSEGSCVAGTKVCACATSADCAAKDDGNACNGTLYCNNKTSYCEVNPATVISCPDVSSSNCETTGCDPQTGACKVQPLPSKAACDDNDPCTAGDFCDGSGTCKSGLKVCACVTDADCASQDDGNPCNGTLYCDKSNPAAGFACKTVPSSVVACSKANDTHCSKNTCNPATGGCGMVAQQNGTACEDGDLCTKGDTCLAGACAKGTDVCACTSDDDCALQEDGNLCNGTLFCNKQSGQCDLNPATIVSCPSADDTFCRVAQCQPKSGKCAMTPTHTGQACNDGNTCTVGEVCDLAGECTATVNTCACAVDADCAKVDDGDLCNGTMFCNLALKQCQVNPATVVTCQTVDDTFCAKNTCIPKTGKCQQVPRNEGLGCDADGNACTVGDACIAGSCVVGTNTCECQQDSDCAKFEADDLCSELFCNSVTNKCQVNPNSVVVCNKADDTLCATNVCLPATGKCAVTPRNQGQACDADGSPCTVGDACDKGSCKPGANTCECQKDADCKGKEDGNPCTGTLVCGANKTCQVDPATVVTCQSGSDTTCAKNTCDPATGACAMKPQNEKVICGPGTLCTGAALCDAKGACVAGVKVDCDDGNPCTADSCDDYKGCLHAPGTGADCDDGNVCTESDVCVQGFCTGKTKPCTGGTPCTIDSCHPLKGCQYDPKTGSCEDGSKCTEDESCVGKACIGKAITCNDGNLCTTDSCHPAKGCVFAANAFACNDGDLCTKNDTCSGGSCVGLPLTVTVDCADGNPCTDESCQKDKGCLYEKSTKPCDDGDPCTKGDSCSNGACTTGSGDACDDGNACTKDACSAKDGSCSHTSPSDLACDDGDPCTEGDTCSAGACQAGAPNTCDDDDPCTSDSCDAKLAKGCVHAATSGPDCDDGNLCTVSDTCIKGSCAGVAKTCTGGTICTVDSCHPLKGCVYTPKTGSCDDGNACTKGDLCSGSQCVGVPITCNDGNACTDDSCNTKSGCTTTPNTTPCDDGDLCTKPDACSGGSCVGLPFDASAVCDDNNACTDEGCAKATGCFYVKPTRDCDDGDPCTGGDTCSNGACKSGTIDPCDDNNTCTKDACSKAGCAFSPVTDGTTCDDGNPCTAASACGSGKCAGTATTVCDDKNVCTTDACDPKTGCTATAGANGKACDDGDACTTKDACTSGVCKASAAVSCDDGEPCTTDSCDSKVGCKHVAVIDGKVCAEGSDATCSVAGQCLSGVCTGASARAWSANSVASMSNCDSIVPFNNGTWLLVGERSNASNIKEPAWARVRFNGTVQASGSLESTAAGRFIGIEASSDGTFSAVGWTRQDTLGDEEGLYVRYAADGSIVHKRVFAGQKYDALSRVLRDASGIRTLGGTTKSKGAGGYDAWVVRLDAKDNLLWDKTYGSVVDEELRDITFAKDGSVFVGVELGSFGTANVASWLLKLGSDGSVLAEIVDGDASSNKQSVHALELASDGSLLVVGGSKTRSFAADLKSVTIKPGDGNQTDIALGSDGDFATTAKGNLRIYNSSGKVLVSGGSADNGEIQRVLMPDSDSTLALGASSCSLRRTDAFGAVDCATSGACFAKKRSDCDDGSLCTPTDTCTAGACAHPSPKVCNDNNICTDDSCTAATGACVYSNKETGASCTTDSTACAIDGICDAGVCYNDGVMGWERKFLPFYACCGDDNNNTNQYQGTRIAALAVRDDGQIWVTGVGTNKTTINSVFSKVLHGTGGTYGSYNSVSGARYAFFDRNTSGDSIDHDLTKYVVMGAGTLADRSGVSLVRYYERKWSSSSAWVGTNQTALLSNGQANGRLVLSSAATTEPRDFAMAANQSTGYALTKARNGSNKNAFTVYVTNHPGAGKQITLTSTWQQQLGELDDPLGLDAVPTGGVIVVGSTRVAADSTPDKIAASLWDAKGQVTWTKLLDRVDLAVVKDIAWTQHGPILTGQKKVTVGGSTVSMVWVHVFDGAGGDRFDRTLLPTTSTSEGRRVVRTTTGFAIGGKAENQQALLRFDDHANLVGDKRFGNEIVDWAEMPSGGFVGAGYGTIKVNNQNVSAGYVVRVDPFGTLSCNEIGGCMGKAYEDCDDGNGCTADVCSGTKGCVHTPINDGASCSDGNACTTGDTCATGVCKPSTTLSSGVACDDGLPCWKPGTCGSDGKCAASPLCSDGDPCTTDTCDGGVCSYPKASGVSGCN